MGVDHSVVGGYGFKISQKVAEKYLAEHDHDEEGAWEFFTELANKNNLSYVEAGSYYRAAWPVGAFVAPSTEFNSDDLDGWYDEYADEPDVAEVSALWHLRAEIHGTESVPELGMIIGGLWH